MQDEVQQNSADSLIDENVRFTDALINNLMLSDKEYDSDEIIAILSSKPENARLMYGRISMTIFLIKGGDTLDVMLARIKGLFEKPIDDGMKKILCKLYDHIDLAVHQIDKINLELKQATEKAAGRAAEKAAKHAAGRAASKAASAAKTQIGNTLDEKIKQTEKTYITTFATIASILFGLVGGLAFSFQAINRVGSQDFLGLLSVICLIGAFIIGVLSVLIWLILPLTHRVTSAEKVSPSKKFCIFSCVIIIILIIASIALAVLDSKQATEFFGRIFEKLRNFITTNANES